MLKGLPFLFLLLIYFENANTSSILSVWTCKPKIVDFYLIRGIKKKNATVIQYEPTKEGDAIIRLHYNVTFLVKTGPVKVRCVLYKYENGKYISILRKKTESLCEDQVIGPYAFPLTARVDDKCFLQAGNKVFDVYPPHIFDTFPQLSVLKGRYKLKVYTHSPTLNMVDYMVFYTCF